MRGLKEMVQMARVEELLSDIPTDKLLSIVMRLTKGHANPSTVEAAIMEIKNAKN